MNRKLISVICVTCIFHQILANIASIDGTLSSLSEKLPKIDLTNASAAIGDLCKDIPISLINEWKKFQDKTVLFDAAQSELQKVQEKIVAQKKIIAESKVMKYKALVNLVVEGIYNVAHVTVAVKEAISLDEKLTEYKSIFSAINITCAAEISKLIGMYQSAKDLDETLGGVSGYPAAKAYIDEVIAAGYNNSAKIAGINRKKVPELLTLP